MIKILSIDGGGIRGLVPALVLEELERRLGKPVHQVFDMFAGTSTGGILALGLTRPGASATTRALSPTDLVGLYREHGREIFARSFWRGMASVGGLTEEKYPVANLERLLSRYLGESAMRDALKPTMVTSYDIEERRPFFFKSWRADRNGVPMWRAGRATSAAPTYFEPAEVEVGGRVRALVDGGVFVNNPALSAYAEARRLHPNETDFLVVSLGTGEHTRSIARDDAKDWGLVQWAGPLLSVIFDGVSDAVDYQLDHILGDTRHFRFQTSLDKASDDMDNASAANLYALAAEAQDVLRDGAERLDQLAAILA